MKTIAMMGHSPSILSILIQPLVKAGHQLWLSQRPESWRDLMDLSPDAIVVQMTRSSEAYNRPIWEPDDDIVGYDLLRAATSTLAMRELPLVTVGIGLRADDLSRVREGELHFDFPHDLDAYAERIVAYLDRLRSQKITKCLCPQCGDRLLTVPGEASAFICAYCSAIVSQLSTGNFDVSTSVFGRVGFRIDRLEHAPA